MKLKMIVGIALIVFILVAGNIIAFGLIQPSVNEGTINKSGDAVKNIIDNSTVIITPKNETPVVQPVVVTPTLQNKTQTPVVTPKPAPAPAPTPVRTRAS